MARFTAGDFLALDQRQRRAVHLALCERALARWHEFVDNAGALEYLDSVVGLRHVVDLDLPADALACARAGKDTLSVGRRYVEPIVALQDDDFELPDALELAYYAVYNLFEKYACHRQVDDWLIVKQALASAPTHDDGEAWFSAAMEAAGRPGDGETA